MFTRMCDVSRDSVFLSCVRIGNIGNAVCLSLYLNLSNIFMFTRLCDVSRDSVLQVVR